MQIEQIFILSQNHAALQKRELEDQNLGAHDLLIETECSFISAGTELSIFTGEDKGTITEGGWCAWPFAAGYANVGRVLQVGPRVSRFVVGDRVFSFGPHASHHIWDSDNPMRLSATVPDGVDSSLAAASRMGQVALTSLDVASGGYNRWVAVWGLGMVGNLAAQAFQIAGNRVIGIDPSLHRRHLALDCGLAHAIGGSPSEVLEKIRDLTGGLGAHITVDAVGHCAIARQCIEATASHGEFIMLGSPKTSVEGDLMDVLSSAHFRWVTVKGALEWRVPAIHQLENQHSQLKKHEALMAWIGDGRLKIAPMLSHRLPPAQIQAAYEGLLHQKDDFVGVVLDWKQGAGTGRA